MATLGDVRVHLWRAPDPHPGDCCATLGRSPKGAGERQLRTWMVLGRPAPHASRRSRVASVRQPRYATTCPPQVNLAAQTGTAPQKSGGALVMKLAVVVPFL